MKKLYYDMIPFIDAGNMPDYIVTAFNIIGVSTHYQNDILFLDNMEEEQIDPEDVDDEYNARVMIFEWLKKSCIPQDKDGGFTVAIGAT